MATRISLVPFVLAALALPAASQSFPINECGTLVQTASCVMLETNSGSLYTLPANAFQVGDYVWVGGSVDPTCTSPCGQGDGCVTINFISSCGPGTMFCGNPIDPALPTPCPCANFGNYAHGCANSANPSGALLTATGNAQSGSVTLQASKVISAGLVIFLQGDVIHPHGAVFGDGTRCIEGDLLRLAAKTASNGTATYPTTAELTIPERAAQLGSPIGPNAVRAYQTYYRDPDPNFCTGPSGATFNITNAVKITWP